VTTAAELAMRELLRNGGCLQIAEVDSVLLLNGLRDLTKQGEAEFVASVASYMLPVRRRGLEVVK